MPLDETRKEAWERMQAANIRPTATFEGDRLHGGGGGGTSGGMDVSMKDYVDARDAVVASDLKADIAGVRADIADIKASVSADIADIKASVSKLPGYGSLIGTALAIVGILLAALSFGNDRFSAGISLADQRQQQIKRDDAQDAALRRTDAKLDEILKRLPAKP